MDAKYTFQAVGRRVAVVPEEADEITKGGIIMPESAQIRPNIGVVQSVGEQVKEFQPGDLVAYAPYTGAPLELPGGQGLWLLSEDDVYGVIRADGDSAAEASEDGRTEQESVE